MEGQERREKLLTLLTKIKEPLSGSALAKMLGVSRQIIVQDIALLRVTNKNILSTTRGYIIYKNESYKVHRCFQVSHTTEEIADELCTIVDAGGKVMDVIIEHPIYGLITVDLIISTRQDVYDFVENVESKKTVPLKELTDNLHVHTVEADSEEILDRIEQALRDKNYLIMVDKNKNM